MDHDCPTQDHLITISYAVNGFLRLAEGLGDNTGLPDLPEEVVRREALDAFIEVVNAIDPARSPTGCFVAPGPRAAQMGRLHRLALRGLRSFFDRMGKSNGLSVPVESESPQDASSPIYHLPALFPLKEQDLASLIAYAGWLPRPPTATAAEFPGPAPDDPDPSIGGYPYVDAHGTTIIPTPITAEPGWIEGTRSDLNEALGKSRKYPDYLERQHARGELELHPDRPPYRIRKRNPDEHRAVAARLAAIQLEREERSRRRRSV